MKWRHIHISIKSLVLGLVLALALLSCSQAGSPSEPSSKDGSGPEILTLPELAAVDLNDGKLKVVATTSIIGDVVSQVGGGAIELTTLIGPGQDPHSYEPAARDLTALADAHVVFVNGWQLEEGLVDDLEEIAVNVPVVAISAKIAPLALGINEHDHEAEGEEKELVDEDGHSGVDPHVWFNINNVKQWVDNLELVLSDLDPDNAAAYTSNAAAYLAELETLEEYVDSQLVQIPEDRRLLVTNHESLRYFAEAYSFTILGTVIPTASTVAEPSARGLANLVEEMKAHGVCSLITETTVSDSLAQMVANELDGCEGVQILKLYTGATGPAGSETDSYIGMFRSNVDTITAGLR